MRRRALYHLLVIGGLSSAIVACVPQPPGVYDVINSGVKFEGERLNIYLAPPLLSIDNTQGGEVERATLYARGKDLAITGLMIGGQEAPAPECRNQGRGVFCNLNGIPRGSVMAVKYAGTLETGNLAFSREGRRRVLGFDFR